MFQVGLLKYIYKDYVQFRGQKLWTSSMKKKNQEGMTELLTAINFPFAHTVNGSGSLSRC